MSKMVYLFLFFVFTSSLIAEGVDGFDSAIMVDYSNDRQGFVIDRKYVTQEVVLDKLAFPCSNYTKQQAYNAQFVPSDTSLENLIGNISGEKVLSGQSASSNAEASVNDSDSGIVYEDFTLFQRVGAATLNVFAGLGSFLMGDTGGGILIVATSTMSPFLISAINDDPLTCILLSTAIAEVIGIVRAATFHKPGLRDTTGLQPGFDIAIYPSLSDWDQSTVKLRYTVQY